PKPFPLPAVSFSPAGFPRGFAMLIILGAVFALNVQAQQPVPPSRRLPVVRDSTGIDTAKIARRRKYQGSRKAGTADDQRTAFKDATAKSTLLRARVARLTQDSALTSYD